MIEVHDYQAILFAVRADGAGIYLSSIGDAIGWILSESDLPEMEDLFSGYAKATHEQHAGIRMPKSPGIYVLEGSYSDDGLNDWISGAVRPAVLADFARFGLPTPLPRNPEETR